MPRADGYKETPASRAESGEAMFAVAPSGGWVLLRLRLSFDPPLPLLQCASAGWVSESNMHPLLAHPSSTGVPPCVQRA